MTQVHLIPELVGPATRILLSTTLDLARLSQYAQDGTDPSDHERYNPGRMVNRCWDCYGHHVTEALLSLWTPYFSNIWSVELAPTYSYARYHWPGAELKRHVDRPSCEYSATVLLACEPDPWPIYMAGQEYVLNPGDCITYKGAEVEHWREPFRGERCLIATFHWVDSQGQYAHERWDGRTGLGMKPVKYNR